MIVITNWALSKTALVAPLKMYGISRRLVHYYTYIRYNIIQHRYYAQNLKFNAFVALSCMFRGVLACVPLSPPQSMHAY